MVDIFKSLRKLRKETCSLNTYTVVHGAKFESMQKTLVIIFTRIPYLTFVIWLNMGCYYNTTGLFNMVAAHCSYSTIVIVYIHVTSNFRLAYTQIRQILYPLHHHHTVKTAIYIIYHKQQLPPVTLTTLP